MEHAHGKDKEATLIGLIRCEKNMDRCPLTSCLRCLEERKEGFAGYEACRLVGVFVCHCPGERTPEFAGILKSKGAEAIHFCTCSFAGRQEGVWSLQEGGFCDHLDEIIEQAQQATGLPCIKGTAHLPKDYPLETWT